MNLFQKKAFSYLEKAAAKKGRVLDIRAWEPATVFEVDLHLPQTDMQQWQAVQHIKVKVGEGTYRDYSPAMWDSETRTCTLIVDAGHEGAGSNWIRNLKAGDELVYLGVAPTGHKPMPAGNIFCVGDASAIGHFLALEQLTRHSGSFNGVILLNKPEHGEAFGEYFRTSLKPVLVESPSAVPEQAYRNIISNQMVYMAGSIPVMSGLKKQIRKLDYFSGQVKMQGFWS